MDEETDANNVPMEQDVLPNDKPDESGATESGVETVNVENKANADVDVDVGETELDKFCEQELKQEEDTFITEVRVIDDSGRGEGVGKRNVNNEEDDLGIYEDTGGDSEGQSDTEEELQRLREEKRQREEEERLERERRQAEEKRLREERFMKEHEARLREKQLAKEQLELELAYFEKPEITPRTDLGATSKASVRSMSDPRFLQGLSLKELYWRTEAGEKPTLTTNMALQIEQSM